MKYKERVLYYGFRDKDVGGWSCGGKTRTRTRTRTLHCSCDPYFSSFLRAETYREACYVCAYANTNRVGDLTIGDFWGVEEFYPNIDSKKGVSLCIVNTKNGKKLFDCIKADFFCFNCSIDEIIAKNVNLKMPSLRPEVRDTIYNGIDECSSVEYFQTFKYDSKVYFFIKNILAKILPKKIKIMIKRRVIQND